MTEQNFEQLRSAMVASQLRTTAVNDPRVIAAMAAVPRERFVPADRAALAYLDIAVPLGGGRALPAPMVLGRLLTEARPRGAERALVVGAGTGYSAAVLARLVGAVVALEEDEQLAASAPVIAGEAPVTRVAGPLAEGWAASAPYDVILLDGAVEEVPPALVAQLGEGGRLLAPVVDAGGVTRLATGRKVEGSFGMVGFADADAPVLPGFARSPAFTF